MTTEELRSRLTVDSGFWKYVADSFDCLHPSLQDMIHGLMCEYMEETKIPASQDAIAEEVREIEREVMKGENNGNA